jgi:hypothetical protein
MSIDKNNLLVTYPCKISLASVTDNAVGISDPFEVILSSISMRVAPVSNVNGILYNNEVRCNLSGLDMDTLSKLDQYQRDQYQVRVQYDDGKIFTVATTINPMDFNSTSIDASHTIILRNESIEPPFYDTSLNNIDQGLPLTLTFSLT